MEKSREVQYNLWSEGDFLESTSVEQKVFLPHFIERGINKRGYYCDTLIQEFVCGTALSSLLVNGDLSCQSAQIKINISRNIIYYINLIRIENENCYTFRCCRSNLY